jgi:hypothetical protein
VPLLRLFAGEAHAVDCQAVAFAQLQASIAVNSELQTILEFLNRADLSDCFDYSGEHSAYQNNKLKPRMMKLSALSGQLSAISLQLSVIDRWSFSHPLK